MPEICFFLGIHIYMYNELGGRHHYPHVHVSFSDSNAVFKIEDGRLMEGYLPTNKTRVLQKWIEERKKELMELWGALNRKNVTITVFKIDPPKGKKG